MECEFVIYKIEKKGYIIFLTKSKVWFISCKCLAGRELKAFLQRPT